jgi:Protein of unknown function (DUF1592)/Protein of unknown function (DUF1588)/Protein of unknown function (DUF1585)/Protein of unknown function (DUF1587)/Protein of unknown function (DUF1595)
MGMVLGAALSTLLLACTGNIGNGGGGPGAGSGAPGGLPTEGSSSTGAGGSAPGIGGSGPAGSCMSLGSASNFHRLNAKQYQETVNQLLFTQQALVADLPADSSLFGFDNNADTSLTAATTQKYLDVAETAVKAALASADARAKLVPCSLTPDAGACVKTVLTSWLPLAFRRPVTPQEVDKYAAYTSVCSSSGEAGLSCALQAALLSPSFLFRSELLSSPEVAACSESTPLVSTADSVLSQYALASRLSYFLWNGPPDAKLYSLAASSTLNDPQVLGEQVDRMLATDAVASHKVGFIQDYPSQWLPLTALASVKPSTAVFPAFDEPLRQAMAGESLAFFAEVVAGNHSALDLVKADYTFANERLAQHYGLPGVTGTELRKVDTTGTLRGGIPTQATFLTATSSTENTSLVLRAKWVLKNLLCVDLPPPPPKSVIDSVPIPDPGLGLTNRESLEKRTAGEPCHSCHLNINPIGFGLETFDGIGASRTTDKGKNIDSSGELIGGLKFANTAELLALLRKDDRFPACTTNKLLSYALGRGMVANCDQSEIDALTAAFKADDLKLRNHVVRIVQSNLFRSARARVEVVQ